MAGVVRWCLGNKSIVFLVTVILIVSGAYGATQLNEELLPDIDFPIITVSTPVAGAGPDVVDEQVTQPIEVAIAGVEGIEGVQATSAQGFSSLLVEFSLDTDSQEAEDELNRRLQGIALPEQAGEPEVQSQSISDVPVQSISLSAADGDLESLTEYATETAIPDIEDVEGVASADLLGGSENQIRVNLDLDALSESGLPPEAVVAAISSANTNAPAGSVEIEGLSTPIRTTSEVTDIEDLRNLPISAAALGGAAPSGASGEAPSGEAPSGDASTGGIPSGAAPEGTEPSAASSSEEPVLLGDVAEVSEVESDIAGISRSDGEPSIGLNITKEREANTVEVAEDVEGALAGIRDDLGEERVDVIFDSAEDVEESVDGLVEKALLGGALAIFIIFLFLRSVRATLVTAVSLPTSILAALLFSWGNDLTLNIITLAGLTIAVGRVVDDAIVVLENSYRYIQKGYEPEEAALRGTTEVASAITSSTLTTVAVFLPLGLVGGIISEFFLPLSLTVAFALLASLLVSITVIPILTSTFIKRSESGKSEPVEPREDDGEYGDTRRNLPNRPGSFGNGFRLLVGGAAFLLASVACAAVAVLFGVVEPSELLESRIIVGAAAALAAILAVGLVAFLVRQSRGGDDRPSEASSGSRDGILVGIYTPMLWWSLRHRAVVAILAVVAFVGGLAIIPFLAVSFFPPSEERLLNAQIETTSGNSQSQTAGEIEPFEDFLLDDPGVESYQLSVGGEDSFAPAGSVRPENEAQSFIAVASDADVQNTLDRVDDEGRDLFGEGFRVEVLSQGPPTGGLEVSITGGTEDELRGASEAVVDELSGIEGLSNVRSDITGESPEIEVVVNPERAAEAGVSASGLSASLGTLLGNGSVLELDGTPVVVGAPEGSVDSVDAVRELPAGPGVSVGDVTDVEERIAPSAIGRSDGERAVTISASITATDTSGLSADVESAVSDLELPGGTEAVIGGESEEIAESFQDLILSILIALAIVYLVLVVFFRSLLVPLVILLAVPLTTTGAFGALLVTGTTLSVPALLGVLLLIGIVVANAILLVDFVINAGRSSETLDEAIIEAGRARLRPILMTALATIFALIPLALGVGGGGSVLVSSSLAIPVIGGLITSTLLTLIVVPVGYSLLREPRRKKGAEEWG
ncbi:MAG: efflux RND transporter permease subunit [Rubrobacter sp.]|nr:efflux RND transporter permease subunit [Rubrobacter sp.]